MWGDWGDTQMLLTTDSKVSYATLLFDSFSSDYDEEPEHFYLLCDPYIEHLKSVTSKYEWHWQVIICRYLYQRLSSLNYAFVLNKSSVKKEECAKPHIFLKCYF